MAEAPAPRRLGDFELLRELGSGGMGTVWEALQVSLGRHVALKLLAPHISMSATALKKFQREAEAGARINHPNIVAVYQVGEADGVNYIAQELVPGGISLADHLAEVSKYDGLPQDYYQKVAGIFLKTAEALHAAHQVGIVHRDVKPANILLTQDGQPKVADFGLALVEDALELSRTGEFSGTPYYMSPEQAMSKRVDLDLRTDIFSLGASFWEALALRRPFEGDTSHQVLQKILTEDPGPPEAVRPDSPPALGQICLKAMEKNPDARYQKMEDLIQDIESSLKGEKISVSSQRSPITRQKPAKGKSPRITNWTGLIGLCGVLIGLVAVLADPIEELVDDLFNDRSHRASLGDLEIITVHFGDYSERVLQAGQLYKILKANFPERFFVINPSFAEAVELRFRTPIAISGSRTIKKYHLIELVQNLFQTVGIQLSQINSIFELRASSPTNTEQARLLALPEVNWDDVESVHIERDTGAFQ